jgi:hypothetical protein
MGDLAWLHQVFPIPPDVLGECRLVGAARHALKAGKASQKVWNPDHDVIGCVGESLVGMLTGIRWTRLVHPAGDGGFDYPGTDVKSSSAFNVLDETRLLAHPVNSRWWAPYFAHVIVQSDFAVCRYTGWATSEMLRAGRTHDWGSGPSYVLNDRQLNAGLPPPLTG